MRYLPPIVSSRKVLLVDDSALVRAVVAHALGSAGFEVACIEDPKGLAAEVARFAPDLLLVDASYPGITDDLLVELVGVHAKALPVVLFSDRSEAELTALKGRIGARGFVPKDGATLAARLGAF
jgi:DNA-binding response OmpR family regulator